LTVKQLQRLINEVGKISCLESDGAKLATCGEPYFCGLKSTQEIEVQSNFKCVIYECKESAL